MKYKHLSRRNLTGACTYGLKKKMDKIKAHILQEWPTAFITQMEDVDNLIGLPFPVSCKADSENPIYTI